MSNRGSSLERSRSRESNRPTEQKRSARNKNSVCRVSAATETGQAPSLRLVACSAQHFPRQRAGHLSVFNDGHAVDKHILHADRQAIGIIESCEVPHRLWIE